MVTIRELENGRDHMVTRAVPDARFSTSANADVDFTL